MEKKWITWLFFFFTVAAGMVLFSQGVSFARWTETRAVDYFIDKHAELLVIAGVGLFVVGMWCYRLHSRIEKLEQMIKGRKFSNDMD